MRFFWLFVALTPLFIWDISHQGYPTSDAGFYMSQSQNIYQAFQRTPKLQAIKFTILENRYKPILHQHLGALFLWMSGGDSRLAIKIYNLVFLSILAFASLQLAELFLPFQAAAFCMLLLTWSKWVFNSAQVFNAELPFIAISFCSLYFYYAHRKTKELKNVCGFYLFLSLALMIRPIEAGLSLFPFAIFLIYKLFINKKINRIELIELIGYSLFCLSILIIPFFYYKDPSSYLAIKTQASIILMLMVIFLFSSKHNPTFSIIALSISLTTLFYIPSAFQLFNWIFDTSFGGAVQRVSGTEWSFFNFISRFISAMGFSGILFVIIGMIFTGFNKLPIKFNPELLIIFCSIIALPAIAIFSSSEDTRYFYFNFLLTLFFCLFFFLRSIPVKFNFIKNRWPIYVCFLIFIHYVFYPQVSRTGLKTISNYFLGNGLTFTATKESSAKDIINILKNEIPAGGKIIYFENEYIYLQDFDLFAMKVASNELNLDWDFSKWDGETLDKVNLAQFILIGPILNNQVDPPITTNELLKKLLGKTIHTPIKIIKESHFSATLNGILFQFKLIKKEVLAAKKEIIPNGHK